MLCDIRSSTWYSVTATGVGGWEGKGVQKGGDVCLPVADQADVWQKPSQYCKALILQ